MIIHNCVYVISTYITAVDNRVAVDNLVAVNCWGGDLVSLVNVVLLKEIENLLDNSDHSLYTDRNNRHKSLYDCS